MNIYQKINKHYPPLLELAPLVLLVYAFIYTGAHYAQLPDQIPTHFGASGLPDAWSAKGFWSVYVGLVIGSVVWLSIALINYFLIIKPEDPGKYINISKQQKEKLGRDHLEAIRHLTARAMILINLTVVVLMVVIQDGSINTALGLQVGLSNITDVLVALLIIEAIAFSIKSISMTFSSKVKE